MLLGSGIEILKRHVWPFVFLLVLWSPKTMAQFGPDYYQSDSSFLKTHSPHKATFMSALVPGLGQIYNEKYWKVPVIYAGFTGLFYYAGYNNFVYTKYKNAYDIKYRIKNGETGLVDLEPKATLENLKQAKQIWRRYRDLMYISIGILYVAQIIDADVDAHLFDFDMSEDLTLHVEPMIEPIQTTAFSNTQGTSFGVRCAIKF
ncbi:MAG: hypothetical protein A2W97_11575 [Bacteroidetes bacterium GWE2_40_63]|nr:MAG: hypothetical protein A2W84_07070 [Bacteroidetes bacterium GWC2_40_13]OFX74353.1 MAG: hypothetical protein A2W96_13590 [Bacteroidetes bacterium GWD2_40_43]OFX95234.1 MAG: hypothetical protein A2W97_11575 [Bacteroidetes bacterium GWE2_40_63]OFY21126.1 MAG: hypothetical protein A2W88_18745 [Bacteroidetes bacterium GWF2_40_13]HBX83782.1 hypothetical protein [Marinilabiliales bacterium]